MNKRNKVTVIIVVILSIITSWLIIQNKNGTIKESLRDFAVEDTSSITKIFLADRQNHAVTLQRIKPGMWKVNDTYFARNDAVNTLLYTVKALEVKQPVAKKTREHVIKQLAAKSIKVEIYSNDDLVKIYYVGEDTPDHLGTYMLLSDPVTGENSVMPFVMYIPGFDGYLTPRYMTTSGEWRDRVVFKVIPTAIKSVKVEFSEAPEHSFELAVTGQNNFQLKQLRTNTLLPFDTMAVKQYLSYYQSVNFETLLSDYMGKARVDSITSGTPPVYFIELTDMNGNKNLVKMWRRPPMDPEERDESGEPLKYDPDRMYALINDGRDFVLVQFFVFGKLLQPLDYFMPKKQKLSNLPAN